MDDTPEFFRVFIPYASSHQMAVPVAFTKNFKRVIPKKVILFDHSQKLWHVEVEQTDECLCISDGWQGFATYHSLECGDLLIFRCYGNSIFEVKIFNKDGCKKEVIVDNTTLQESKGGKACERSVHVVQQKHLGVCFKKNEEACCSSKATGQRKLEDLEETKMPKDSYFVASKNPYFVLEISNHSKYFVYLPRLVFHPLSIKLMPNVVIHNQNGNMWLVKGNFQNNGKIYFGCGWCAFIKENNVFEFVLGGENIYNEVHVQIIYGNARLEKPSQHRIRKNY